MIAGGLGNQMFQYASARALALRHGTELLLDLSPFGRGDQFGILRAFELGKLSVRARPAGRAAKLGFLLARRPNLVLRALSGWHVVREGSGDYRRDFETLPDDSYLIGYWQSWRYFEGAAAAIHAELQPLLPLSAESRRLQEEIRAGNALSLHVRRGDYLSPAVEQTHGVLGLDYYERAIRMLQERSVGLRAFVFSDDLEWCRAAFAHLGLNLTLVDCNRAADSWQDLYLMADCRHAVIANSSFSWWGAWLGDHGEPAADRMVVAPVRWFAAAGTDLANRCPPQWQLL